MMIYRHENFDNIHKWIKAANGKSEMYVRRSRDTHDPNFFGTNTYEEAIDYALKGWKEGAKTVNDYLLRLTPFLRTVKGYKTQWVNGMLPGGSLSIDRYSKGLPDCMFNRARRPSNKFAKIVINGSMHHYVGTEQFMRRGALIIALVYTLEKNNYRCEIGVQNCTLGSDRTLVTYATLKRYNESLDLDRIAFWAGHLAVNRRISFSYRETMDATWRSALDTGGGYGRSADFIPEEKGVIYFPSIASVSQHFNNTESMVVYLKELLSKMGINVL
jgi:hypothetical protein